MALKVSKFCVILYQWAEQICHIWNVVCNANYAIQTWYYQWGSAEFKIGIGHNAYFEMCATPLVIPGSLAE